MDRYRLIRWSLALGALGFAALCAVYFVINIIPGVIPDALVEKAREPDLLKYPQAKRCADCHKDIFDAWKKSRHSVAWVSEGYVKATENHSKEKCLNCHIPTTVIPGEKPQPRLKHRDDGIYCVPCHVKDDAMHGPYDILSPPHPTKQNDAYRTAKFCSSCHEKTYKQWEATGSKKTCQSCHMQRKLARLTQSFPKSLLHAKREVADHSFPKREITEVDIAVTGSFGKRVFELELTNLNVPHWVPTADNGDPRMYLYTTFFDEAGKAIDEYKEILAPQQETALPYKKPVQYRYLAGNDVHRAELLIQYTPAWSKEKTDVKRVHFSR